MTPNYRYKVIFRRKGHKKKTFVGIFVKYNAFGDLIFHIQPLAYTPIQVGEKEIIQIGWTQDVLCKPS